MIYVNIYKLYKQYVYVNMYIYIYIYISLTLTLCKRFSAWSIVGTQKVLAMMMKTMMMMMIVA